MRRLPHRALDLLLASMKFQHNQTSLPLAKRPYLNRLVLANVHWPGLRLHALDLQVVQLYAIVRFHVILCMH
jgi:hypothetical protein